MVLSVFLSSPRAASPLRWWWESGNRDSRTVMWIGASAKPSLLLYSPFSSASRHRLDGRSDSACNFLSLFSFLLFFSFFLTNFILFSVFFFNVNLYRGVQRLMDWSDYIIMQKHRLYYIFFKRKRQTILVSFFFFSSLRVLIDSNYEGVHFFLLA